MSNTRNIVRILALSLSLLTFACDGDGRPFKEAVEANDLRLQSIEIVQPVGLLSDLFVNTGARVSFDVRAKNTAGATIALSADNRRWSVNNSDIASIDDSGNLSTIATGDIIVRLQIGGLAAEFPVTIQDETLQTISAIVGDETIERCIPKDYFAKGIFSLGSERGLPNVAWSVDNAELGTLGASLDGKVRVNGVNVGVMKLIATLDGAQKDMMISIEDTLNEIVIEPATLVVDLGQPLSLSAFGQYFKEGVDTVGSNGRKLPITNSVQWRISGREGVATVSNQSPNWGAVTTQTIGITDVTAACGITSSEPKTLQVRERSSSISSELSMEQESIFGLSLSGGVQQLRVSTGSTYNEIEDRTTSDDTSWSVKTPGEGEDADVVTFEGTGKKGLILPLNVGRATVRAEYDGRFVELQVQVSSP